jgi:hypothetical protein
VTRSPPLSESNLARLQLDQLREAIRSNFLSFPSPVPVFEWDPHPDLQWKFVQLYFILGWECRRIAVKYGASPNKVRRILKAWGRRAMATGYIQYIPPSLEFHLSSARHARCQIWIPDLEIRPGMTMR